MSLFTEDSCMLTSINLQSSSLWKHVQTVEISLINESSLPNLTKPVEDVNAYFSSSRTGSIGKHHFTINEPLSAVQSY